MVAGKARDFVNRAASHRRARRHERFLVPLGVRTRDIPRFVFLAPDFDRPAGGIRVMYDQVDSLNDAGRCAVIMHQSSAFRCTWFPNNTAVTWADSDEIFANDVLVIPELFVDVLGKRGIKHPHIILNQSGHLTWSINGDAVAEHLRRQDGLLGVVVPSQHIRRYLTYALPELRVEVVRNAVDGDLFRPASTPPRVISFLDRRDTGDVHQVLRILGARGSLEGWRVHGISVSDQAAYAAELRACQIFVSTPYQEGFGMPAIEAMASGAFVVGYHGYGGQEYFRPEFSAPVETGDVVGLATALEGALTAAKVDHQWCSSRGRAAARFVRSEYSRTNARRDAVEAYGALTDVNGAI